MVDSFDIAGQRGNSTGPTAISTVVQRLRFTDDW